MCALFRVLAIHAAIAHQLLAVDVEDVLSLGILELHEHRKEVPLIHQGTDGDQHRVLDFEQWYNDHVEQLGFDVGDFVNVRIVSTLATKCLCEQMQTTTPHTRLVKASKWGLRL